MIIITGANGALNGTTARHLLQLVPASEVAVTIRDLASGDAWRELGVEVRRADYEEPSTLRPAFEGADQVLLVSSNVPGANVEVLHGAAIDAARDVGVGRLLYTSHQGASPDTPFWPGRGHAATERLLEESGVAWTSLRNGFYAHSLSHLLGPWRESDVVTIPADGPVSWTSRADEAEAAAVILAAGGGYDGPLTLTASDAPTFAELAPLLSELAGHDVEVRVVEPEAWVASMVEAGQSERMARFSLGMFEAAAGGFFAGTDPLLAELIGREPATVRDALTA